MRISDWSSDVCSSDLYFRCPQPGLQAPEIAAPLHSHSHPTTRYRSRRTCHHHSQARRRRESHQAEQIDRKRVVSGKSVSVRVDLGGRRIIKKKNKKKENK